MALRIIKTSSGSKGIEIINLLSRNSCKPRGRDEVLVTFSQEFDRKTEQWIEDSINSIWAVKCQENGRFYNGSKFRFAGFNMTDIENRVILNIGLTSYKDLMGTNCDLAGEKLVRYGLEKFGDSSSFLSNALGVGSLVLTKDDKFLFMKRALWTGEDKGKLDRPGGHPEPDNISGEDGKATQVRDEIFNSVLHEIRDEMNIPVNTLTDPLLLGIVRNLERLGRPSAEFFVRCSLTSKQVEERYSLNTQPEADESLGIVFLPEEEVRAKKLEPSIWHTLTDAACGAIELYHQCHIDPADLTAAVQ